LLPKDKLLGKFNDRRAIYELLVFSGAISANWPLVKSKWATKWANSPTFERPVGGVGPLLKIPRITSVIEIKILTSGRWSK